MTINVTELASLDSEAVRQADELLAEMLQEANPTINAKQGVFRDYLGHYGAILAVKNQTEMDRLRRSQSLREVLRDPSLADTDVVDNIASNFRVTRQAGSRASGTVTLVVSRLEALTVAVGTLFETRGQQFATQQVFTARTSRGDMVSPDDRELTPVGDGTYSFQIAVVAISDGEAGNVQKDTYFAVSPSPTNYVKAFAAEDFRNGKDEENNLDLVDRFVLGMAAKAFSGRENMLAAVKAEAEFAGIVADSIIGMGDQEMHRDQHSIFPGSLGGRVDWYLRTQASCAKYGAKKKAVLVEKTSDGYGIWQMVFDRDEYPGLYDVTIKPDTGDTFLGSFEVTADIRSADMSELSVGDGFLPDIAAASEAVYSRFQSVILQFRDTLTLTDNLQINSSEASYAITVRALPLIAELQEYALRRRVRNVMGDVLIKAPVPCFLNLTFTIELKPGQASPDAEAIAISLASLVNYYGFTGRLPASKLADIVHDYLEPGTGLSAIDMFGEVKKPTGTSRFLRSTEVLEVPDEAADMSTRRTVAFFLDPADVTINIITADILEV